VDRTSAFGVLRYAEDYRVVAGLAHAAKGGFTVPAYSNIGQSIELSLKAYLLTRGVAPAELRKHAIRHTLAKLLELADAHRINRLVGLQDVERGAILDLSEPYRLHLFRYFEAGTMTVPKWEFISITAEHLTKGLRAHCLRRLLGRDGANRAIATRGDRF
jgi:hypothetical protein